MKIALSQQNYILGDFEYNLVKIKQDIQRAIEHKAALIVFSELSITGYPPTDFFNFKDFVKKTEQAISDLLPWSKQIAIVVGAPRYNEKPEGKDLYNAAYFLNEGVCQQIVNKTLLPTYDIFDEYRYFEPNTTFHCIDFKGTKIALTICEDIWDIETNNPLYQKSPMEELILQKPDIMINISASPFSYSHIEERKATVRANCLKYQLPMIYCSSVGAQTELVFDGGSMVYNEKGESVYELNYFEEDFAVIDSEALIPNIKTQPHTEKVERKYQALVLGIRDYFAKSKFKKAVLGLSGGVDSALTLALAVEALGAENVLSVLMPSQYSSDHSIQDALDICANLGSPYEIIPIKDSFEMIKGSLSPIFKELPENVTEENIQARVRGILLMAVSNKFGNILLNTSNKSEMAVGYGTLYGDMCGGLAVLGDLFKTEVYEMCHFINRDKILIPENTIVKAPSAELKPGQVDQDSLPPYDILDTILYQYINKEKGPDEIIAMGYDRDLVVRILNMVNRNEFKRFQAAPILRVSSKAFGFGRRIPIVAKYLC